MRYDLLVGLNNWAKNYVRAARRETIGHIRGAYKPRVGALRRYTLPGGTVVEEFVQATPWYCGPNYHLALRWPTGEVIQESLWAREQL